ncbi:MAG TPA: DegT/DnrJ/EryC1/StrS family aminotransferase [Gaiellaceae bacterium]|nr:DegT/DnrJ/EryC1/StrS family aminotransferase [Gaiellaceae bacterium]
MTETRWRVPLSDVIVDDELVEAALETLRSGWWSMGPRVAEFEQAFAEFCGSANAVAVANGTAALHLGLLALGCGPGDEVVLPSLNFVAAANAIVHTGAQPVFCDIGGPDDLNLDPGDLESALTRRTKAVLVLHYGGYPCDMQAVSGLAGRAGVAVLEDAAHAPGASLDERACGTIGAAGCFSFFANKNLPLGEGGMIVTADDVLAERLRLLRSHGMTSLTWDRHRGHASTYDVVLPGFNYRLDEVRAAVGLVQLRRLPDENAARARIAARYRDALDGEDGLTMPFEEARGVPAHHLAVVLLPEGTDRDEVRGALEERGIQTSVHYPPIHTLSAYRDRSRRPLPRTDVVAGRILTLPLYGRMTDDQVEEVVLGVLQTL